MKGCIRKRDVLAVAWVVGVWAAIKLLVSRRPVALQILVESMRA